MPRYFFHMASKEAQLVDSKGREMAYLAAAHECALGLIHKTMHYLPAEDSKGWMVKVANTEGHVDLVVLFPSALSH